MLRESVNVKNVPKGPHGEEIDTPEAKGIVFRAYEESENLDIASFTVADVTEDPTEPDISTLDQKDIPGLDNFLHEGIRTQLAADGMELIQWMSSQLSQTKDFKGVVTAYIARDQGKDRQFIALRISVKGRKVVIIGCFDVAKKEILAAPIFNAMRNISVMV